MQSALKKLTRCLVCGFTEVRTDEVLDRGLVFLAECQRCQHRWTAPAPPASPERPPMRAAREASTAA